MQFFGRDMENETLDMSLEVHIAGTRDAAGDLGGIAPAFRFLRGNKALRALSLLGFFGPVLLFLPGHLCSLVAILAFGPPSHCFPLRLPRGWPRDWATLLKRLLKLWCRVYETWPACRHLNYWQRKTKCILYAKERCGCSSYYLTDSIPALIVFPIPCLNSRVGL